jgi:O-methyltransferase
MISTFIHKSLRKLGYDLVPFREQPAFPPDFDEATIDIIRRVHPYTMTSAERLYALRQAVQYVVTANIPGSIVECGVWRGGSMMSVAHTLRQIGCLNRDLYLFDTYEGMPKPTANDVDLTGKPAAFQFESTKQGEDNSDWCYASIEDVQANLYSTEYTKDRLKLIKGKVEETIPDSAPEQIALLRLDTDWYESTMHELVHLYPRLSVGGVLIIDDYGHWRGSRKATDEYFARHKIPILLNRVDYTARIAIKCNF